MIFVSYTVIFLHGSDFVGSDFVGSDFVGSDFVGSDFVGSDFEMDNTSSTGKAFIVIS